MPPVSQFSISGCLILRQHIVIQSGNLIRNSAFVFPAHILDRLTHQIAGLEGNNLVRPVLDNDVVNLRPDFFLPAPDRLLTLVVAVEVVNLALILDVRKQGFLKNRDNIIPCNFFNIRINYTPAEQSSARRITHLLTTRYSIPL